MKLSKIMHIVSVIVGFSAVVTFLAAITGGDNNVFGITKTDALLCTGILVLFAIWSLLGAMHHMKLEKHGEII
jgi:hypothetical protein